MRLKNELATALIGLLLSSPILADNNENPITHRIDTDPLLYEDPPQAPTNKDKRFVEFKGKDTRENKFKEMVFWFHELDEYTFSIDTPFYITENMIVSGLSAYADVFSLKNFFQPSTSYRDSIQALLDGPHEFTGEEIHRSKNGKETHHKNKKYQMKEMLPSQAIGRFYLKGLEILESEGLITQEDIKRLRNKMDETFNSMDNLIQTLIRKNSGACNLGDHSRKHQPDESSINIVSNHYMSAVEEKRLSLLDTHISLFDGLLEKTDLGTKADFVEHLDGVADMLSKQVKDETKLLTQELRLRTKKCFPDIQESSRQPDPMRDQGTRPVDKSSTEDR